MTTPLPTHVMILAAGLGKRMRSFNSAVPKPLVEVAGKTLIDWALDLVVQGGISHAVVNTHYMAEMLEAHLAKRSRPSIAISRENELLETGGGIKKALPLLGNAPFFSINSDVISTHGTRPIFTRMAEMWRNDLRGVLLVVRKEHASGYEGKGDFHLLPDGRLQRRGEDELADFVFTGIQLLNPALFAHAPEGAFSMNVLYNLDMADDRILQGFRGIEHDGLWLHVGDKAGHEAAERILSTHPVSV